MRIAIFEASRRFEEKTQSKKDKGRYKPVLTIKKTPPRGQGFLQTIPGSEDSGSPKKDELFELPCKGSRERKKRIRVMSDITGLGVEPIS